MKNFLLKWLSGLSTMRFLFHCFLLLLFPSLMQAQGIKEACGIYHKPLSESSVNQRIDLVDQFGNAYTFDELNIERFRERHNEGSRNASNCTGGDFVLEFSGLTCDEEITVCNVFQEISDLIDIGPNGSNPIIAVVKEPFQNDDGTNNTNVLGEGITYFQTDCGIANNLIFDVMYSDIANNLPAGLASGVLRLNDLLPFYNDVQGPVAGNYDLHTVALHEVLHILGYSSQMADGGGTVQGFYSRWDTHLFSDDDSENLITPGTSIPGCCDIAVFNPLLDYSQVITTDCNMNIFFRENGQNIAEAYGENYPSTNPGGLLSHLDRCGTTGDQYVMSASLAALEEKDITQEEIDILEALGYEMEGQDVACSVIVNNDLLFLNNTNPGAIETILYSQIFSNDNLPDDFDPATDLTFHLAGSGCGTVDEFDLSTFFFEDIPIWNRFEIRIPLCGRIDICYTITGCDGVCDDGTMTIERACSPCYPLLPDCPPADVCAGDNLFCYGDFQSFIPKSPGGLEPIFELDSPHCSGLQGSPDLFYNPANGNRIIGFFSSESIIIPLSTPVAPGCSIDVSFRTTGTDSGLINVFGTSISPCQLGETPMCPSTNQSDFQCIADFAFIEGSNSINSGSIPCDNTTPPDIDCTCTPDIPTYDTPFNWTMATLPTFVNNSGESINFLYFNTDAGYAYLDDLVVTANCENEMTTIVDHQVDACRGGIAEIDVLVCIEGTNNTANDVTLTANFQNLPGLNITQGTDFVGGTALLANTIAGTAGNPNCYVRQFSLDIGHNITAGSQLQIEFEAEVANSCPGSNSLLVSTINIIDCDIPCILESYPTITASCGNDGAIDVIVAGGSGTYNYQWSGNFGNTPSISGLAPGIYEFLATDVTDPNCFVKGEFTVPVGDDCNTNCTGDGSLAIEHKVVQMVCLESEPGFYRYYIDMYIPNWPGTQTNTFELCSEDLFVTTPGVILESSEILLYQSFAAANIFAIIKVPINTQIDQGICFDTPICVNAGQVCGNFCVTDFPVCSEASCTLEVVPTVTLSPMTNTSCGSLSGDDLYVGNVSLAIQNANGISIDYVQYIQINGNADPTFWQENNVPVIGGVANLSDQAICWKSYDNEYFCFRVRIGYSDGVDHFECEVNICLLLSDILSGMLDDGAGGERRQNDLSFQKNKNINSVFPVFPNPVNQNLNVQNPQQVPVTLTLMTLQGKLLNQQKLNGHAHTRMKVGDYAPGIYLLRICEASSGAILQMEKVIVSH